MDRWRQLEQVLGGERALGRPITADADVTKLVRHGVPLAAVLVLARTFDLSRAEMGQLVGNKTSHPVKLLGEFWFREGLPNPVERLGPVASRNFIEAATVLAHARSVFGSDIELSGWLREPLAVLSRRRPIDLLSSPETRQEVDAVLTRIEHGVFA